MNLPMWAKIVLASLGGGLILFILYKCCCKKEDSAPPVTVMRQNEIAHDSDVSGGHDEVKVHQHEPAPGYDTVYPVPPPSYTATGGEPFYPPSAGGEAFYPPSGAVGTAYPPPSGAVGTAYPPPSGGLGTTYSPPSGDTTVDYPPPSGDTTVDYPPPSYSLPPVEGHGGHGVHDGDGGGD